MGDTLKRKVKKLLKEHNFKPNRKMGQNFLVSQEILDKIIEVSQLTSQDIILEIGPGLGILTKELAKKARQVVAVEKDSLLTSFLKGQFENFKNVKIISGDILHLDGSEFIFGAGDKTYKVVANLPYYITNPVLRKFLESPPSPSLMILMVQKEVAERICAVPPKMSKLSVFSQLYSHPEIICFVSRKLFYPSPKVDSALIKVVPLTVQFSKQFYQDFSKIVKAGFAFPRKQLGGNFKRGFNLSNNQLRDLFFENGIAPTQRAETLSVNDWIKLTKSFQVKLFQKKR